MTGIQRGPPGRTPVPRGGPAPQPAAAEYPPSDTTTPAVRFSVRGAQLRQLFRQVPTAVGVNILLLLVLVPLLHGAVPGARLMSWALALVGVNAVRWQAGRRYARGGSASAERAVRLFTGATMASGIIWGLGAPLFMAAAAPPVDFVIVIAIAGLAAGAIPLLACVRRLYFAYLACILLPTGTWFLLQGTTADLALSVMTLLFGVTLGFAGHNHAANFTQLQELAAALRRAKDRTDHANRQLRAEIAESRRIQAALQASEQRFHSAFEQAPIGIALAAQDGSVLQANPMLAELLGYDVAALQRSRLSDLVLDEDATGFESSLSALIEGAEPRTHLDVRFVRQDGALLWAAVGVAFVGTRDARDAHFIVEVQDITDAVHMSARLQYEATHDELTGLTNRREFERRLTQLIASAGDRDTLHTLCYLDLDRFKVINDSEGHVAGDEVLRQVSGVLHEHLRAGDMIARVGGDEFAVLLEHCDIPAAEHVAAGLVRAVSEFRFLWNGKVFRLDLSVGIAAIEPHHRAIADLLRAADTACATAKEIGGARYHTFRINDADMQRRHGEVAWVTRITEALERDGFQLYAQTIAPTVPDAADAGVRFEILLRMAGHGGELLIPGAFLPAAERYGLATRLDRWVVDSVLHWFRSHPEQAARVASCAINLSGASLADHEFSDHLMQMVRAAPLAPRQLRFEITETAAIGHMTQARRFMQRLESLGCRFALDDFGSGLSSFGYLRALPVDTLKIDGQFVRDIARDRVDHALVKSINDVGRVLGLETIAEFVEDEPTLHLLQAMGVDFVQGHYIGVPCPLAQCLAGVPE